MKERDRAQGIIFAGTELSLLLTAGTVSETPLRALACKRDVTVIDITSSRMVMAPGFLRRRQSLQRRQAAGRFVEGAEICEGAADVDADSIAHRWVPSVGKSMPCAGSRDAG